ncbi:YajQ family cyclic di-GMP-binding protein [Candidatus Saganbacteria bacterium]|nr:YajQ family cyclic di-GMP-binding protein [Candidatus Saganbacteria bacterium]
MADEHSFDIVSKPNVPEVENALQMAVKEIANRFDFKGSTTSLVKEAEKIKITSEDEYKLKAAGTVLQDKLARRQVHLKFFDYGKIENSAGGGVKQQITLKQGIPQEQAKEIVKFIKTLGLKVQASIQSDQIRVTAKKIDDLQAVMQQIKAKDFPIVLQFVNYR